MARIGSFAVTADTGCLSEIRRFVREEAEQLGLGEDGVSDLVMATDEAATNAIVHGYRGRPGRVEIRVVSRPAAVEVHVIDEAPAFDPTSFPGFATSESTEDLAAGGLGIFFIRRLVDRFTHRLRPQGGNELILVKRIERRSRPCASQ